MYFVSRWREDSPFSKRVVTLPDATVLSWFQRAWNRDDPAAWIESELDGDVYGLDSVFDEARERNLPRPETVNELRELLHEHLWVEGDDDYIRVGERALRVRTDDDEVDLAYYFIDDKAAAALPDRLAFLLHDTWPLPSAVAASGTAFIPDVPMRTVRFASPGAESVFSVRLCWGSPDLDRNLHLAGAVAFLGLTLPDLAVRLRDADSPVAQGWPHDARLLRALLCGRPSRWSDWTPTLRRPPATSTASSGSISGSSSMADGRPRTRTWPARCCATPPTGTRSHSRNSG